MRKVAIPTKNERLDSHFGHARSFRVYTIENNQISGSEIIDSGQGCGCKSNIIQVLHQQGVTVMLAGNMGEGAYQRLRAGGFEVIRGCAGEVDSLVYSYIAGDLQDDGSHCQRHHHHRHGV